MKLYITIAIIAYFIGSINFSVIFSRKFAGFDIREKGSKNAGATNMLRNVGKKVATITLICDILKGVFAILIAIWLGKNEQNPALLVQIAGIAVILGHTYPIFFEFRGGKGVATTLGILLMTNWQIGLICLVFALCIMIASKMVSAGSILSAVLFPVLTLILSDNIHYIVSGNYFIYSLIIAAIIIFNHRANLKRILDGTENKLSFNKK